MLSQFCIRRPIFATVLSIIIVLDVPYAFLGAMAAL